MAIGDIYKVVMEGRLHGQTILNTLHYAVSIAGAGNEPSALTGLVETEIVVPLKIFWSMEYEYRRTVAQKINPLPVAAAYASNALAGFGGVAEDSLPTSVAATITKKTALAGQKYRGRIYVAGIPLSYEEESELTAAAQSVLQDVASQMALSLDDGTFQFVPLIWHTADSTFNYLTECEARVPLHNQRRRQVGKGV